MQHSFRGNAEGVSVPSIKQLQLGQIGFFRMFYSYFHGHAPYLVWVDAVSYCSLCEHRMQPPCEFNLIKGLQSARLGIRLNQLKRIISMLENIPPQLQELDRWVVRRGKVPYQSLHPSRNASNKKPEHWSSFEEAIAAEDSGVGLVMTGLHETTLEIFAVDIDHCISDEGLLNAAATQLVRDLQIYWETSPSGRGLRGFGFGVFPGKSFLNHAEGVEMYNGDAPRFLTVTGNVWGDYDEMYYIDEESMAAAYNLYATGGESVGERSELPPIPEMPGGDVMFENPIPKLPFILDADPGDKPSGSEALARDIHKLCHQDWAPEDIFGLLMEQDHLLIMGDEHWKGSGHEKYLWNEVWKQHEAVELKKPQDNFNNLTLSEETQAFIDSCQLGGAFSKSLKPMRFVVEHILQRGYVSALSGFSNAGKTAIANAIVKAVVMGEPLGPYPVKKGRVLYLAGENSQNVQMRFRGMEEFFNLPKGVLDAVIVKDETFPIHGKLDVLRNALKYWDDVVLVVVDSKLVFFEGNSEDDNREAMDQAADFNKIARMHNDPAVLVLAHPAKGLTSQQALEPRGGGAFLNQIDANLTAWNEGSTTQLWWAKKIRGGGFNPITLELIEPELKGMTMELSGDAVSTVLAVPASEERAEELHGKGLGYRNLVLLAMFEQAGMGQRRICERLEWPSKLKTRVLRAQQALLDEKLIKDGLTKQDPPTVTKKGDEYAKLLLAQGLELPAEETF